MLLFTSIFFFFFFFNDTATTEIYTLSLHDALPISSAPPGCCSPAPARASSCPTSSRSEEHTSELQSPCNLVCRLLLEKKKDQVEIALCIFSICGREYIIFIFIFQASIALPTSTSANHFLPLFQLIFFCFTDTATTEIYTLSLHDALPIFAAAARGLVRIERGVGHETQTREHQPAIGGGIELAQEIVVARRAPALHGGIRATQAEAQADETDARVDVEEHAEERQARVGEHEQQQVGRDEDRIDVRRRLAAPEREGSEHHEHRGQE